MRCVPLFRVFNALSQLEKFDRSMNTSSVGCRVWHLGLSMVDQNGTPKAIDTYKMALSQATIPYSFLHEGFVEGLKVIDLSSVLAGPLTGSFWPNVGPTC